MDSNTWPDRVEKVLTEWSDNESGANAVDYAEDMARLLDAATSGDILADIFTSNRDLRAALSRIDEALSAYEAGAANAGNPDAVISEVRAILDGRDLP